MAHPGRLALMFAPSRSQATETGGGAAKASFEVLDSPNNPSAAPPGLKTARPREEADSYPHIIARLNDNWRVIDGNCGIQWILQRCSGKRDGSPRWEGSAFCRTRDGLLSNIMERCGEVDEAGLRTVERLPGRMTSRSQR